MVERMTDAWVLDENKRSTQKVKIKTPDSPMDQDLQSDVTGMMKGIKFVQGTGRHNVTNMKPRGMPTIMDGSVLVKIKDQTQQRLDSPSSFNIKMKEEGKVLNPASGVLQTTQPQMAQLQTAQPQISWSPTATGIKPKGKRKRDSPELDVLYNDVLRMKKEVMDLYADINSGKPDMDTTICLDTKEVVEKEMKEGNAFAVDRNCVVVGKGSFGTAYSKTLNNGKTVVIKEMTRNPNSKAEVNEVMASLGLRKPGILRIFGLKCLGDKLSIMMEDAGRSLKWWLTNAENDAFRCWHRLGGNLKKFSISLFNILKLLEIQAIVHRDVKPENLCLTRRNGEFVVTLIDFGSAQSSQDKVGLAGHSPEYLPPRCTRIIYLAKKSQEYQLHQNLFFEEKCDAWAVAIVILTVFNGGYHPIQAVNCYSPVEEEQNPQRLEVMEQIIQMTEGYFEPLLKGLEDSLQHVLRKILQLRKEDRWTARQAVQYLEGDRLTSLHAGTPLDVDGQRPVLKIQKMSFDVGQFLEQNCQGQGKPLLRPSNLAPPQQPPTIVGVQNPAANLMPSRDDQQTHRMREEVRGGLSAMGIRTKVIGMPLLKETPTHATMPSSNGCGTGGPRIVGMGGPKIVGMGGPKIVGMGGPKVVGMGGPTSKLNASHLNDGFWKMRHSLVGGFESCTTNGTPTPVATGMSVGTRRPVVGGFESCTTNGTPTPIPTADGTMNRGKNIPNILFDDDEDIKMETTKSAMAATAAASQKTSALGIRRMFGAQPETSEDMGPPGFGNANHWQTPAHLEGGYSVPKLDMMLDMGVTTNCSGNPKRPRRIQTGRRRSSNDKPCMR